MALMTYEKNCEDGCLDKKHSSHFLALTTKLLIEQTHPKVFHPSSD